MDNRTAPLLCILIAALFPTLAMGSDFGPMVTSGLYLLAGLSLVPLVLAGITSFLLDRYARLALSWWWLSPLLTAGWFYVAINVFWFIQ